MLPLMSKPLAQKVILITGSSRGIGRATALKLADLGAHIAVNFVMNREAAEKTADEIRLKGVQAITCQANVGSPTDVDHLIQTAVDHFGRLDAVIHNAALGAFKPVHKLRVNQWDLSLDVNAKAFLLLAQKAMPWLEKSGQGNLIALSSLGSHRFIPNYGAIGVSKAALENLVRYLAVELAPKKIRVNCISGGLVDTDALKAYPDYESFHKEVIAKTPAGRIAAPEDLANAVSLLLLPESNWIIGQTIIADGGLSLI